jgi:hypothetical protein
MTDHPPYDVSWEVALDSRRRPTLPAELLAAAHVDPDERLVARPDGEGRIVLETRAAIRARIRARFMEDRAREGRTGSAVEELFEERKRDQSLT